MNRNRMIMPLAVPLGALVTAGIIVFIISRILLGVAATYGKTATPPVALVIAALILIGCSLVAARVSK
jgi:amino acid transporter